MKISPVDLQNKKDNPFIYLFYVVTLHTLLLVFPQHIGFNLTLVLCCAILFIVRPLWGTFFIIAVYPVTSCSFDVFSSIGLPVELSSSLQVPHGDSPNSPLIHPTTVFPFQITSFVLLPSLIFHYRPFSSPAFPILRQKRFFYITLSFFFLWGIIISLHAVYPGKAFLGLSRFLSIIILIRYLIRSIDTSYIFRKILITYSVTAVSLSFFAYFGTYYGFEKTITILNDYGISILQKQSLINGSTAFTPEAQGMLPGFGIAAKHEFSTFAVTAFFASIYLFITEKKQSNSLWYIFASFTILLSLYYGPSKLSLAGIFVAVFLVITFCSSIRKNVAFIMLLLVALNISCFIVSGYTRPLHAQKMAGATQGLNVVNDDSEFSLSLKGRIAIMKQAAGNIKRSNGAGIGPDMLSYDHVFTHVHGHNLFVTFSTEYGVPSIICLVILGTLLAQKIFPVLTSSTYIRNATSSSIIFLAAAVIAILFEYSFDCFVWAPQLWIASALLWIATDITTKNINPNILKPNEQT